MTQAWRRPESHAVCFPPCALKAFAFLKLGKMDTFFFFLNPNGFNLYPVL